MIQSTEIIYGPKVHVLAQEIWHRFHNNLGITEPFKQKDGWYEVLQDDFDRWWLHLVVGFMWNGADWFPDYEFMMFPSAIHDPCLWLIDHGIIPETYNNLVDKELEDCILKSKTHMPWWKGGSNKTLRKIEARKIRRATNLARTKQGEHSTLEYQLTRLPI